MCNHPTKGTLFSLSSFFFLGFSWYDLFYVHGSWLQANDRGHAAEYCTNLNGLADHSGEKIV